MGNAPQLLTDIRLEVQHKDFRPVYRVVEEKLRRPGGKGYTLDLSKSEDRNNLAQAVAIRLLTPRGDLSHLGHPDYGSRLHELVGEGNTETNRNLARLYILESLQHEARVEKVLAVSVKPAAGRRSAIEISLRVQPVGDSLSLSIGPFSLELK
jgi:phage baseplate assembly protein W